MDLGLTNRRALVMGASRGLGASIAAALAAEGANLALCARNEAKVSLVAQTLGAEAIVCDLSVDGAAAAAVVDAQRRLGGLDILVINTGGPPAAVFESITDADWRGAFDGLWMSAVGAIRAALPAMVERGSGALINVASVAAFYTFPGSVLYGSTKTWIVAFCRALALELRGKGVRVQALCPGFTHTGFHDTPELRSMKETGIPKFLWMPAEQVIEKSLRALARGPVVCVPGLRNKILVAIPRIPFASPLIRRFSRLRD